MTETAQEVPQAEIQWTTPETPERLAIAAAPEIPAPAGKHHRPEPGDSTRDESPADERHSETAADNTAKPRGRRRTIPDRVRTVPPKDEKDSKPKPPSVRPPDFSEWHEYVSDFALKWASRGYIAFVFRGVDRYELLSKEDNAALQLSDDALSDVAKPLAHLADRSKLGKKYGRVIIDSSDGVQAMIALGMWGARVNRIANKYRKILENGQPSGQAQQSSGSDVPGTAETTEPSTNGYAGANPAAAPRGFGYN
jgi:hypothetical protein